MSDSCDAPSSQGDGIAARFEFDPASDDVIVQVVKAVDEIADSEAADDERVLNDAIDPDALRRCLDSGGPGTRVSFRFDGYSVTTAAEGEILVTR